MNQKHKTPNTIIKELQFRSDKGIFLFAITGEKTDYWYSRFSMMPELNKTTMKIERRGECVVLEALIDFGYTLGDSLRFCLAKGSYIIIILQDGKTD